MAIELACSAYVDHEAAPPTCLGLQPAPRVEEFLEDHVGSLMRKAASDTAPPADFASPDGRRLFAQLAAGTRDEFGAASQALARSLHSQMDGRTKRGVFVALRRSGDPRVAVLKLDVVSEHAGFLAEAGDIDVIDNLLDIPGELQKGAVTPDPRPNSTVIVGDKLGDTSQYFLDALDISQLQKPTAAVADLARVLHKELPADKAEKVIARLPGSEAPTVEAFLESASDVLTDPERKDIVSALTDKARPARYLDARRAAVRRTIRGDGITISGTIRDMDKIKLEPIAGTDRWRLEVVFDSKPETRF